MSVVVAIKENGKVYMGCDSQVTSGGTRMTLKNPNNYKIWKVIGADNCLMGSVGNLRDACVIRTLDDLVTDYNVYRGHICFDFVVNSILPDIIHRLQTCKFISEGKFDSMDSSFLFAFRDQLYNIHSDGSVIEVDDCIAIGSGKNEAVGSLLSTEGEKPETRIIKAIKASAASDIYVDYPIILTDSETTEFKIITENDDKNLSKQKKEKK